MNPIKSLITKLYYKYCFKQSTLASHIIVYYAPLILKDAPSTGTYFFGIINDMIQQNNQILWVPKAGTKSGIIQPLVTINLNEKQIGEN